MRAHTFVAAKSFAAAKLLSLSSSPSRRSDSLAVSLIGLHQTMVTPA
jgi:hypothetical protein